MSGLTITFLSRLMYHLIRIAVHMGNVEGGGSGGVSVWHLNLVQLALVAVRKRTVAKVGEGLSKSGGWVT